MRTFIALDLPEITKEYIAKIQAELHNFVEGRFTPFENLHITLEFLGDISPSESSIVAGIINEVAENIKACDISLSKLFVINKNIVALEVKNNYNLKIAKTMIKERLSAEGFVIEDKPFKPHITLVRQSNYSMNFNEIKKSIHILNRPNVANTITLYQSVFGAGGVKYIPLHQAQTKVQ